MQTIVNLGTGGADLNGQNGSTTSADSNDALLLDWPGDNGGNYVYLSADGNYVRPATDVDTGYQPTGDLTITLHAALDDYTPAVDTMLVARYDSSATRSYWLYLRTDGKLRFVTSATGSGNSTDNSSTEALPVSDGDPIWLRACIDIDNGASGNTVSFYTSTDGSSWTQLGTSLTNSGTTTIYDTGRAVSIGCRSSGLSVSPGKYYRATLADGLHTSAVPFFDVDCSQITSGADTSFTSIVGGKTINIVRATSGRKAVAVVSRVWLLGTDDFMQVADNALLDFGANDDFTVLAALRQWTSASFATIAAKRASWATADQGWLLGNYSDSNLRMEASDGVTEALPNVARTAGVIEVAAVTRDASASQLTAYNNGTPGSVWADASTGDYSNTQVLRIGSRSTGGNYVDMELLSVAVFRRVLTASEISQLSTYYANRWA